MPHMRPLDPAFPIERQIELDATSVVLVNVFTLDKADEQTFLQVWQDDAAFMKQQPGFGQTGTRAGAKAAARYKARVGQIYFDESPKGGSEFNRR